MHTLAEPDAESGALAAERHHWVNTIVGVLDSAFHLTEEEQFFTLEIVGRMLEVLRIPERSRPSRLPAPVAMEVRSSFFTLALHSPRDTGLPRPVRAASATDVVATIDAWRHALLAMISSAYPDLAPLERVQTAKVIDDLLRAIGVPGRAAAHFPEEVIHATHAGM